MKTKHRGKKRRKSADEGGDGGSKDGGEGASVEQSLREVDDEGGKGDERVEESPWGAQKPVEEKSRDEEMEEYLEDLLL